MSRELAQCMEAYLGRNTEQPTPQLDGMNPPTWLDERGQPRPKRPCPPRRTRDPGGDRPTRATEV